MPPGNRRGTRGKCDVLFSKLVRRAGECRACGEREYRKLQCAHVLSRRYSWTRTDLANAMCLCWSCHRKFTDDPFAWTAFVVGQIGEDGLAGLRERAAIRLKFDWDDELVRLTALAKSAR